MYAVNGSDGWCIVTVRLIVGVRYLEHLLREVLMYTVTNACKTFFLQIQIPSHTALPTISDCFQNIQHSLTPSLTILYS